MLFMINKVITKFRSKFQFQIPLGQLKKLKLVMVMVKGFDKYHHLFNLPISITILFFYDWDSSVLNIKVLYRNQ